MNCAFKRTLVCMQTTLTWFPYQKLMHNCFSLTPIYAAQTYLRMCKHLMYLPLCLIAVFVLTALVFTKKIALNSFREMYIRSKGDCNEMVGMEKHETFIFPFAGINKFSMYESSHIEAKHNLMIIIIITKIVYCPKVNQLQFDKSSGANSKLKTIVAQWTIATKGKDFHFRAGVPSVRGVHHVSKVCNSGIITIVTARLLNYNIHAFRSLICCHLLFNYLHRSL